MTSSRRRSRRPSFWVGLVGLAVAALLGVTSGLAGAVAFAALYVAVCALWALVTRRAWWGPTSRPIAGVVAGAALVLVVGAALADGAVRGEGGVEVGSHRPAPSAEDTAPEPVAPEPVAPSPAPSSADPTPTPEETLEAEPGTALAAVARLEVKGRAPRTGYEREHFGQRWADVDRNGCDQRNDVLRRDLNDVVVDDGTGGCVVRSGTLAEPYSGTVVAFERGDDTSALVQIDHVVALADAWQKGAQQWDATTREAFGNDPLNLLAVDGALNTQKGAGDTATWLPPNTAFRCEYVARQVGVKVAYGLWVTQAEKDAMIRVLGECPDEPLPTGDLVPPPGTDGTGAEAARTSGGHPAQESDAAVVGPEVGGGEPGCPVKGNHSSSGELIYHVPSGRYYDVTKPEDCFQTEEEARAAGYRRSKQ
ncbi:DUF1524 domain-containing protein [Cellulosimicrobium sp. I38E]|uniref:GmrSD restriction endonuclease domain-containing protein n=1 Tax=Cellulosimicrobium sp. I38E TaxID=1393139 RepID=UPI0007D8E23B|nr:DUF1524 domain-containing protein [Cellulosimicrobium sp. I38E]